MGRKIFCILLVMAFGSCHAFAENTVEIDGYVKNQNGDPVPAVAIQIKSIKKQVFTNGDGYYKIDDIELGTYKIHFSHIGFASIDTVINVTGNLPSLNISLVESNIITDDIVITGTRTYKDIDNNPIPTEVVSQSSIQKQGTTRLDEILTDQLGLPILDKHGRSVQIQGLDPDYTLILINGEPVIGRSGGMFSLTRFTVGNLERVEIVRGPSSSLYGSNALAGVINLITQQPSKPFELLVSAKYGSYSTYDINGQIEYLTNNKKIGLTLFGNRTSTAGYKVVSQGVPQDNLRSVSQTMPENNSSTFSSELFYKFLPSTTARLNGRLSYETVDDKFYVTTSGYTGVVNALSKAEDMNLNLSVKHNFSLENDFEIKANAERYNTSTNETRQVDGVPFEDFFFRQYSYKLEGIANTVLFEKHRVTGGAGYIIENIEADDIANGKQDAKQFFVYLQEDFMVTDKINLIASARLDRHSDYEPSLNPKVALSWKPFDMLTLRGSVGTGFKAPNFENLYLNWNNPLAGYSVLGSSNVKEGLRQLEESGQIAQVLIMPENLGVLRPEKGFSVDFGFALNPCSFFESKVNVFSNNISDMIDFTPLAIKTNGAKVHTYTNFKRIHTQGLETKFKFTVLEKLTMEANYQYLETEDNDVVNNIKAGKVYRRVGFDDVKVSMDEYGGLFNRSKHSGAVKINYYDSEMELNLFLRGTFRTKYGYQDVNSNSILDEASEYAPGYTLWNFTASKVLGMFTLQAGVDNILDKKDIRLLASSPGRTFFANLIFQYTIE